MRVFSLCFLLFINAMSIGLVFPIFAPLFMQSSALFGGDVLPQVQRFCYAMILAVPTFCMIFGAPFLGGLSDKIGRKKVLIIGLLGLAFSFALSVVGIWQGSLLLLFTSRALAGLMDGSEAIAQAAIVDYSSKDTKARNMSFATFAGTVGFIVGPVIGGLLAEPSLTGRFNYELPFVVSMLLTLVNALILFWFIPAEPKQKVSLVKTKYTALLSQGLKICLDKRIRWFCLLLFVVQWSLASFFELSTMLLSDKYHYSSGEIGLFSTFLGACFAAGIFFVLHVLLKRLQSMTLLRSGMGLVAISLLGGLCLQDLWIMPWICVVPLMLGIAMMYNVLLVLVSNAVSDAEQGEAMGAGTALKALGWLSSGVMLGCWYPNLMLILSFMLMVVVCLFVSTFWGTREQVNT